MIVIFIDSKEDTATFHNVYEGIENIKLMVNPLRCAAEKELEENPNESVFLFGHGSPCGLFAAPNDNLNSYIIDGFNSYLLRNRKVIAVWCYAKEFGKQFGLEGFFTSMFISNQYECEWFGYKHTDKEAFEQNTLFAKRINKLLKENVSLDKWCGILKEQADMSVDFVKFNYDAIEYLEKDEKKWDEIDSMVEYLPF